MWLPGNESKNAVAEPRDAASARSDLDESEPRRRFQSNWGGTLWMMTVLGGGAIGLIDLSHHVARQDQEIEPTDHSGAGLIVRSEPVHLWLPQILTELAQRQSQSPVIRSHEDLRRFLEVEGRQDLWYAMTARGYQVNGEATDITVIRWPYDDAPHLPELLEILATVAGNRSRHPDAVFSRAAIHIVGNELRKCKPREVMAEMLAYPSPNADEEDSP